MARRTDERLPDAPGSYALVFRNATARRVRVGAIGIVALQPGYLIYVGSACGPGGVRARVERHVRRAKPRHWHVDYLRRHLALEEVWFTTATRNREHAWARTLGRSLEIAAARFGSSDCRCPTHLFRSASRPDATRLLATSEARTTVHRLRARAAGAGSHRERGARRPSG